MRRIFLLLIIAVLPVFCHAQFIGLAGQYTPKGDGQFVANLSYPTIHKKNIFNSYISSGLEYSTPGRAELSGLNIKPIQLTTFFSEKLFNNNPFTILLSVDGGYLFDFRKGYKNGIVVTPNLYADYKFFFVKAGYDFDVTNAKNQFFIRAGVSIGMSTFKAFVKTEIW